MKDNDIHAVNNFSRYRQHGTNSKNAREAKGIFKTDNSAYKEQCSTDEFGIQQESCKPKQCNNRADNVANQIVLKQQINVWNGLLPDPDTFSKYSVSVQNKLVEWNDEQIRSNINNENNLTQEYVNNSKTIRRFNYVIYLTSLLVTAVCYILSGFNPLALSFLSVPAFNIGVNIYQDMKNKDK